MAALAFATENRPPASESEARQVLQALRNNHGYLSAENKAELSRLGLETQQVVHGIVETLRRTLAKYTDSVAGESYSEKSRFVYELLQNADDSVYENNDELIDTRDRNTPCVTISLFPDRFLLETNEVGFTIANVAAICATGESSKKKLTEDGSIGEKGYGFKSVFGVASRARIQSGIWSFYFQYDAENPEDNALGMVTPIDIDPVALPSDVTTRIELSLHKDSDLFETLSQKLKELHETTIFFLQKITKLEIRIHPIGRPKEERVFTKTNHPRQTPLLSRICSLTRKDIVNGQPSKLPRTKFYHVLDQLVKGMPSDKHRKGKTMSTIQLAFPYESVTKLPIIDDVGEHVFAYLPLYQKSNLPFLIQGDFVTLTNRQNVQECAWNSHLRTSIAEAFEKAVIRFNADNVLRYQWLKYLPVSLVGGFENPLFNMIKTSLLQAKVFETWQHRRRTYSSQLRILSSSFTHNEEPLFEDLPEEAYLAPEYRNVDYAVLNHMGIRYMNQEELLKRLRCDLGQQNSRYYQRSRSDPWHETCSALLVHFLSSPINQKIVQSIKDLWLIPLRSTKGGRDIPTAVDKWANSNEVYDLHEPIYFSETTIPQNQNMVATRDRLTIPYGIQLRVVHEDKSIGPQGRSLLVKLGVTLCAPITVTDAILTLHCDWKSSQWPLSAATLVSHLQYLYWFRTDSSPIRSPIFIISTRQASGGLVAGKVTRPFYLKSDNRYDTWSLLQNTSVAERDGLATFISDLYMQAENENARSYGRSWKDWLESVAGVRRRPPLLNETSGFFELSSIIRHVLDNRPADFLPILQAHWITEYQRVLDEKPFAKDVLSRVAVLCEQAKPTALHRTYIPTKALKAEARRIGLLQHTPFLKLPEQEIDDNGGTWKFLSTFGVGIKANLEFYLDLVDQAQALDESGTISVHGIVIEIYLKIGSICNREVEETVIQRMRAGRGIYVPSRPGGSRWVEPSECLWDAPACISVKFALADHYGNHNDISTLFRTFLHIQDVHASDYVDQLRYFKKAEQRAEQVCASHASCTEIYRHLSDHQTSGLPHIKDIIESEKLVFVNGSWYGPSQCLWSADTSLSDEISIAGVYGSLKEFFVTKLGVKILTTCTLVSDLVKKATARTPLKIPDAKELILKINTMVAREILDSKLQAMFDNLQKVNCFPVKDKDGHLRLSNASAEFAIIDVDRFGNSFESKVDFYNFNLDDVQTLRPFIEATKMETRYLSNVVKEISEVEGSSTKSEELTNHLQNVAYEFFCCAVRYKSIKVIGHDRSLFDNLLKIEVHEAERMETSLVLKQHGREVRVPSTKTEIKVDLSTVPWKIYVPKEARTRQTCYRSRLPKTIIDILGVSGSDGNVPVHRLIHERHDRDTKNSILEDYDIQPISWITRPLLPPQIEIGNAATDLAASSPPRLASGDAERHELDNSPPGGLFTPTHNPARSRSTGSIPVLENPSASPFSSSTRPNGSTSSRAALGFGSPSSQFASASVYHPRSASAQPLAAFSFGQTRRWREDTPDGRQTDLFFSPNTAGTGSVSASPGPSSIFDTPPSTVVDSPPRTNSRTQTENYIALLDNIIRRTTGHDQAWDFNALAEALPEAVNIPRLFEKDEIFGVRKDDALAHNMKIGAAGEVFVMETLLPALPNFTLDNWLSTIRHEAKVHPHYADMPDTSPDLPAGTREPADIVYADPNGAFLRFLQTQDCVGLDEWLQTPTIPNPTYYIEVKTTTWDCDNVFHMSNAQYARMLKMRKTTFVPAADVYIICRVYHLLSNDIKMRFYVSPGREAHTATGPSLQQQNPVENEGSLFLFNNAFAGLAPGRTSRPILSFASKGYSVTPVRVQVGGVGDG